MNKLRIMLGAADSPYILSLMRLIETQSKATIAKWCLDYAEENILPIFERRCSGDERPRMALAASCDWFEEKKKLPEVKKIILNECHAAARELDGDPAAQAYDRVGLAETAEVYDRIAVEECAKMEAALRAIANPNETNPAKINWWC